MGDIFSFPPGFLWGAATSSHQVEGENIKNDWWAWEELVQPEEKRSGRACDEWNLWEQDWALVQELGHTAHRLSLEWSRIEPEEGVFDELAIEHYRAILQGLKQRGIHVMLTLHHFTNPQWFAAKGGWERVSNRRYFLRYVERIVPRVAEFVDQWVTINEPSVYAFLGYQIGKWPPQVKSIWRMALVFWNLARAHGEAYSLIHRVAPRAQVGIAQNMTSFHARHQHVLREHIAVWITDLINNHAFYWLSGRETHDFLGINYYFHRTLSLTSGRFWPVVLDPQQEARDISDLGWEIRPSGIFDTLMDAAHWKKPIFITENGIATGDDARRVRYLLEYLKEVYHAIQAGADVRGYFHWSLLDNFEWADGYEPKFGLVEVMRETQARVPRASAFVYRDIIHANGIPHGLLRYVGHGMGEELRATFSVSSSETS